ncbi:methyltransferase domain-containing protein [Psychrobium sp. MM17-31]|uniref:class I SAM-dependent methyltransferase n=1 Tax=Psychrobium sp. MM17-31 TaxID=2917758 RepID=UPI001EF6ED02|nr:methyltransferase domain-containing protein [Psychrobium sp. MM17-31]MCG7530513.1 methyltransferase domain-containing protein [Psychrobium sp. MM17-31]
MSCNGEQPAILLQKVNHLLPPSAKVLDLACGFGRNGKYLAAQGHKVSFLDKNSEALAEIQQQRLQSEIIEADLECDNPYQLPQNRYDAIVVFRYLHRPLMPTIVDALKPGGLVVYETFNHQQADIGRPRNPNFLLQDGELATHFPNFELIHQFDGFDEAQQAFISQFVGRKP